MELDRPVLGHTSMVEKVTTLAGQLKLSLKLDPLLPLPDPIAVKSSCAYPAWESAAGQTCKPCLSDSVKGWGPKTLTWAGTSFGLPSLSQEHVTTLCKTTIKCPIHRDGAVTLASKNTQPTGRFSFPSPGTQSPPPPILQALSQRPLLQRASGIHTVVTKALIFQSVHSVWPSMKLTVLQGQLTTMPTIQTVNQSLSRIFLAPPL